MKSLNDEQEESIMSLALLQNKIKRDPPAYREEFLLQLTNFRGLAEALKQQPYRPTRKLQSLVMFLAHTAPCYSAEVQDAWAGGPPKGPQDLPVFDAFGTESIPAPGATRGGPSPSEEVTWAGGPPKGPQDLPVFDAFGTESIPAPGGPPGGPLAF
ncbi:hypothetical protein ENH_00044690 [Eimeria necatrix]|uniref:Protein SDA1 n=1 Tax=Eimeria necatrix TaxID=51315 RepID=U6MY10_9EIME|nr:hypothetical protein ENH_00044690 [Eimeria necatrix]CDJ67923.1 hypothetical protein ENH_00044690 [Eimeria necatrix]